MRETWKEVPGFPGYGVSDLGRVRSFKRAMMRILSPSNDSRYWGLTLMRGGKKYRHRVGRLVLLAFVGPPSDGMEMCHSDGDSLNDRLDNLRYDTHTANLQDASRQGRLKNNGLKPMLDQEEVYTIRTQFASGKRSRQELVGEHRVSRGTINHVLLGKGAYEGGTGIIQKPCTRLSDKQAEAIRRERVSGKSLANLAEEYGISESAISLIASGKRHGNAGGPRIQPYEMLVAA